MSQEDLFAQGEGDAWFNRNRAGLLDDSKVDWPAKVLSLLPALNASSRILEVGCANGYRLANIQKSLGAQCVGVDISADAVADGAQRYPAIELHQGTITQIPLTDQFDIVIVNYVLHWVDRSRLLTALTEIDRLLTDGGILILGDFLPDGPVKRTYHHLPEGEVYTFKQDYAKTFELLGTYKEIVRLCYDHDHSNAQIEAGNSESRAFCVALKKSLDSYYRSDS